MGKDIPFFKNLIIVITPALTRNIQTGNRAIWMTNTFATIVFTQRGKQVSRLIYLVSIQAVLGAWFRRAMNLSRPKTFTFVALISIGKYCPLVIGNAIKQANHVTWRTDQISAGITNTRWTTVHTWKHISRDTIGITIYIGTMGLSLETSAHITAV